MVLNANRLRHASLTVISPNQIASLMVLELLLLLTSTQQTNKNASSLPSYDENIPHGRLTLFPSSHIFWIKSRNGTKTVTLTSLKFGEKQCRSFRMTMAWAE